MIAAAYGFAYSGALVICWPLLGLDARVMALALIVPLIWLSVVDTRTQIIPDIATTMIAVIGMVHLIRDDAGLGIVAELFSSVAVLGLFWLLGDMYWRKTGLDGLGIGDAKLMAAGSLCIGIAQFWLMLLIASLGGILIILLSWRRRSTPQHGVPFGPFLGFAIFLVFMVGAVD
jgi:prepilin signal peptidase PulO-like enzyme (type II secretory pathway)